MEAGVSQTFRQRQALRELVRIIRVGQCQACVWWNAHALDRARTDLAKAYSALDAARADLVIHDHAGHQQREVPAFLRKPA